jgi:hypothetical protein
VGVIAIDFDGTVVDHLFPAVGELKLNAKRVINRIHEAGNEIIMWTCRSEREHILDMEQFLFKNGIKYDKVNSNSDLVSFGCWPKIYYNILIDDRALFFKDNWLLIEKELERIGVI